MTSMRNTIAAATEPPTIAQPLGVILVMYWRMFI